MSVKRAKHDVSVPFSPVFSPGVKAKTKTTEKLPPGVPKRVFDELDQGKAVSVKLGVHSGRITMNVISAFKGGKKHDARVEYTEAHMASIKDDEKRDSVALFLERASEEFNAAARTGDLTLIKPAYEKLYDEVNIRNVLNTGETISSYDGSVRFVRGVCADAVGQTLVFVRDPPDSRAWAVARALVEARNDMERARAARAVHEYNRDPSNALTADLALGYTNTDPIAIVRVGWGLVVPRWACQF